ncbi:tRNA-intron lyase [Candidatus Woesearchaeota archaeon]|nr:tRNA-intron lyase [Candidatus Woesearchaeota archaeon]
MAKKTKKAAQAILVETLTENPAEQKKPKSELIEVSEIDVNLPSQTAENGDKPGKKKVVVKGILAGEKVITESSDEAREFYNQSRFGMLAENRKVELSLLEGLYLVEKGKLTVKSDAGKKLTFESYLKKARGSEPNFWIRYCVFKDIRNRGYIIKTALKFGADFRVYDRGVKPGDDHARWIVYPVHEGDTLTWYEFAAKNRVAHSTKKRLLIGIVDDEGDVTYYEIKWMRP